VLSKSDYDNHRKSTWDGRKPPFSNCDGCKKPLMGGKKTSVVVAQIERGWFRGDDTVHIFHPWCWAALPDKPASVVK
jgi:hypothetical protein